MVSSGRMAGLACLFLEMVNLGATLLMLGPLLVLEILFRTSLMVLTLGSLETRVVGISSRFR